MKNIDGIVLIDKPKGFTSFDVVAVMRGVLGTRKVGHAGTLDPMATGVLPVFCGRLTKLADLLPNRDKDYRGVIKLGMTTDTLDITGRVLKTAPVEITKTDFLSAIKEFEGRILQTPPMYSAVKQNGKRLYDLARQGIEVERKPREIQIYSIGCVSDNRDENEYEIEVSCSKGTYIRTLADDIGKRLGCGAVLKSLCRTKACGFPLDRCIPLEKARGMAAEDLLIPAGDVLSGYIGVTVSDAQAARFKNGGALFTERTALGRDFRGIARVYSEDGALLGLGKSDGSDGLLKVLFLLIV